MKKRKKGAGMTIPMDWNHMTPEQRRQLMQSQKAQGKTEAKAEAKAETKPIAPATTYTYKECHTGTIKVFEIGEGSELIAFYGGGSSHAVVWYPTLHLLLDCANIYPPAVEITGGELPRFSARLLQQGVRVKIYCPDMGVPELDRDDWLELIEDIRAGWKGKGVLACCQGGHGRTGTVLAVLAGLTGATTSDPVKFVRERYCEEAVESVKQIKYVEEITGIKVESLTPGGKKYGNSVYVSSYDPAVWDRFEHGGYSGVTTLEKGGGNDEVGTGKGCCWCKGPLTTDFRCVGCNKPEGECTCY